MPEERSILFRGEEKMMLKKILTIAMGMLVLVLGITAAGEGTAVADSLKGIQAQKIPGEFGGDEFGFSVARGNRYLAVAAKFADGSGIEDSGLVYLYRQGKRTKRWILDQVVTAPDATEGAEFGESVAINRDTLVVGARFANTEITEHAGAAYVFKLDKKVGQWSFQQKLTIDSGHEDDEYGRAVALTAKGDRLVVGARFAQVGGEDAGAVYIYRFDPSAGQWLLEQVVTDEARVGGDEYGRAVAFNPEGDMLVVGARRADGDSVADVGAVFVYDLDRPRGTWTLAQKLQESDLERNDRFGQSVAVFADTLVVGARDAEVRDGSGTVVPNTGAIYIYQWGRKASQWVLSQMITPGDGGASNGQYGFSLALSGHLLAVGARRDGPGAVYLYRRGFAGKWEVARIIIPGDGQPGDEFGQSLALGRSFGAQIVVGADGVEDNTGAVYSLSVHH
jgi:hypothetical protein